MARIDPLRSFRYRLEIDNISHVGFSEVTIAETTIDSIEYREGTDPPYVRKVSGLTKYVNVTLKWGLTIGGTRSSSSSGTPTSRWGRKDKRKKVVIVVQEEAGGDAARIVISDAWPIKYTPSAPNAKGTKSSSSCSSSQTRASSA